LSETKALCLDAHGVVSRMDKGIDGDVRDRKGRNTIVEKVALHDGPNRRAVHRVSDGGKH